MNSLTEGRTNRWCVVYSLTNPGKRYFLLDYKSDSQDRPPTVSSLVLAPLEDFRLVIPVQNSNSAKLASIKFRREQINVFNETKYFLRVARKQSVQFVDEEEPMGIGGQ